MTLRSVTTTLALATLLAAPAGADQRDRHRQNDSRRQDEQSARAREPRAESVQGDRAVPRAEARRDAPSQAPTRAQAQPPRQDLGRRDNASGNNRSNGNNRYDNRGYSGNTRFDNNRYDNRGYGYGSRRYDAHSRSYYYFSGPRVIYPSVVHVIAYRPYVYRPSFSIGVYYGSGGYYPYGYTPDYYFQPIPGRLYGGVRITGAPRDARVFADGYFVGLVDDFDGIFQHMNLEAGPHRIEIDWGGYQPLAFDIYVRPGVTTTFRAAY